jgi:hypothetical protein
MFYVIICYSFKVDTPRMTPSLNACHHGNFTLQVTMIHQLAYIRRSNFTLLLQYNKLYKSCIAYFRNHKTLYSLLWYMTYSCHYCSWEELKCTKTSWLPVACSSYQVPRKSVNLFVVMRAEQTDKHTHVQAWWHRSTPSLIKQGNSVNMSKMCHNILKHRWNNLGPVISSKYFLNILWLMAAVACW